jgi:hypothetical protein
MLPFEFTVSIADTKPMPQVQITESVSRANYSLLPPQTFALLCFAFCGNRQRNYSTRGLIALTSLKLKTIENSYLQFSSTAIRKHRETEKKNN